MTFDVPLLLFLSPLLAFAFAAGAWMALRQRIRLARRWSPSLGRLARSRRMQLRDAAQLAILKAAVQHGSRV